MTRPLRIDFQCNDPDNGIFNHDCRAIQIGDGEPLLELENWADRPPTFRVGSGLVRLSGKPWPIVGSQEWIGNWCWNAYWMPVDQVMRFLEWLNGRGLYSVSQGESRLFELWQAQRPWVDTDRAFVRRLLEKAAG